MTKRSWFYKKTNVVLNDHRKTSHNLCFSPIFEKENFERFHFYELCRHTLYDQKLQQRVKWLWRHNSFGLHLVTSWHYDIIIILIIDTMRYVTWVLYRVYMYSVFNDNILHSNLAHLHKHAYLHCILII